MTTCNGIDQSELQLLVTTQTVTDLFAIPIRKADKVVWAIDVKFDNGDRAMLTLARRRTERRVWTQLSALHRFVSAKLPQIESLTVMTAPIDVE